MYLKKRVSVMERSSVFTKPPPIRIGISGCACRSHWASRRELNKFPGKGTLNAITLDLLSAMCFSNSGCVMRSIKLKGFWRASSISSKEEAQRPRCSAYRLKPKSGSIVSRIKSQRSSRYKVAR